MSTIIDKGIRWWRDWNSRRRTECSRGVKKGGNVAKVMFTVDPSPPQFSDPHTKIQERPPAHAISRGRSNLHVYGGVVPVRSRPSKTLTIHDPTFTKSHTQYSGAHYSGNTISDDDPTTNGFESTKAYPDSVTAHSATLCNLIPYTCTTEVITPYPLTSDISTSLIRFPPVTRKEMNDMNSDHNPRTQRTIHEASSGLSESQAPSLERVKGVGFHSSSERGKGIAFSFSSEREKGMVLNSSPERGKRASFNSSSEKKKGRIFTSSLERGKGTVFSSILERKKGTAFKCGINRQTGTLWVPVLLTLLGIVPVLARESHSHSVNSLGSSYWRSKLSGEGLFLQLNNTEITAQAGAMADLPCRLSMPLGDRMVSWVRRRHYQVLTVGRQVYSSDERVGVKVGEDGREWVLTIRYVTHQDAGQYQCQVSSHPPRALTLILQVVEAQAEIVGGPERYIHHGSSLLLVCLLKGATEPPVYVFWYRGDRMINYDKEAGVAVDNSRHSSKLYIASVSGQDAGNYTCVPNNAAQASVLVTVIQKENPVGLLQNSNTENGGASSSPKTSKTFPSKAKNDVTEGRASSVSLAYLPLVLPTILLPLFLPPFFR